MDSIQKTNRSVVRENARSDVEGANVQRPWQGKGNPVGNKILGVFSLIRGGRAVTKVWEKRSEG